jgi:hypothetical protein
MTGPEILTRAEQLMSEISKENLAGLTDFARKRLVMVGLPYHLDEDIAQTAICDVLNGSRHPRAQDVQSIESFENYLRGIINSIVNKMRRKLTFEAQQEPNIPEPSSIASPDFEAIQADLKSKLFPLLKQRMAPRHMPTIEAWEAVFEYTDRIPVIKGRRKYVAEIREVAQQIVQEMGYAPRFKAPLKTQQYLHHDETIHFSPSLHCNVTSSTAFIAPTIS